MTPDQPRRDFPVDDYNLERFTPVIAGFGCDRYGYLVTPNADHLIRWHEDERFRESYAAAQFVLLDSRFVARLVRARLGLSLAVCPGSDLTEALLAQVVAADDRIVLIGGEPSQATALAARFGLTDLHHHNPPMGFADDPVAIEAALAFVESHSPFRFCLLAVGAPRQEMLALALAKRGVARGLALCVGASIDFLTGKERRAPATLQRLGLEWLYRLMQNPRRLAARYLVRGPRVFRLIPRTNFQPRTADPSVR
jgi:exopolysaccharide biosynthesis WecB/TagA/CpsF family protein